MRACVCVGAGGAGGSNAKIASLDLPNYGQVYVCQFNIIENIKNNFRKNKDDDHLEVVVVVIIGKREFV